MPLPQVFVPYTLKFPDVAVDEKEIVGLFVVPPVMVAPLPEYAQL